MTIGWGWLGYCWNKPVFAVVVRPQRHTFELIQQAGGFTVSIPEGDTLKKELAFAGTKSGRDLDKFEGHGLTAIPAQQVDAPIIGECGLHFECKTLLTQDMTEDRMAEEVLNRVYPTRDLHTMFFGEIVDCYRTKQK